MFFQRILLHQILWSRRGQDDFVAVLFVGSEKSVVPQALNFPSRD
jgi:hypothetical protein